MLQHMGFKDVNKGLGKNEDGRIEPLQVGKSKTKLGDGTKSIKDPHDEPK